MGYNPVAVWTSLGGRWTAVLYRVADGYRLSERKHDSEVGASYRPFSLLSDDAAAVAYYDRHVATAFDVPMARVRKHA